MAYERVKPTKIFNRIIIKDLMKTQAYIWHIFAKRNSHHVINFLLYVLYDSIPQYWRHTLSYVPENDSRPSAKSLFAAYTAFQYKLRKYRK